MNSSVSCFSATASSCRLFSHFWFHGAAFLLFVAELDAPKSIALILGIAPREKLDTIAQSSVAVSDAGFKTHSHMHLDSPLEVRLLADSTDQARER